MTLASTYSCFGCVDYANNARTAAYVGWACRMGRFEGPKPQLRWLCDCPDDDPLVPYTNPIDDNVCWYDPLIPESADFLGVIITDIKGIRASTFTREVFDNVQGGSVLGRPTRKGKNLVFEAIIVASSQAGFNYGVEWLRRQFEQDGNCKQSGSSCASCYGQVLTIRLFCPEADDRDRGLRTYPTAGTVDGITELEDNYPMGRQNCFQMRVVTWTMQTETADGFSPDPISECTASSVDAYAVLNQCASGDPTDNQDGCCASCSGSCPACIIDPACESTIPFAVTPVVLGSTAPCFCDPVCRTVETLSLDCIPFGYDAALRFTLYAGFDGSNTLFSTYGMRNVVISIYENPNSIPPPQTYTEYDDFVNRLRPCSRIGVSWIPAGSELVIDGLSGRSWLKCEGKCYDHSSRVSEISGSVFPLTASCVPITVLVEWDTINVQPEDSASQLPSTVTMTTYLRHLT